MPARLTWNGDKILAKVTEATIVAHDFTMAAAVSQAKRLHPLWNNRTSFLEASISIEEPAVYTGHRVTGQWGATANYALYLEIGTSRQGSGAPRAQVRVADANGDMSRILPPFPLQDPLMRPRTWLRPSASVHYPLFAGRIGTAYRGEELA